MGYRELDRFFDAHNEEHLPESSSMSDPIDLGYPPLLTLFYEKVSAVVLSNTLSQSSQSSQSAQSDQPLTGTSAWRAVPGIVFDREGLAGSKSLIDDLQSYLFSGHAVRVVSGWCVEIVNQQKCGKTTLILGHHSVIETPDGRWVCPSTPADAFLEFFEDPALELKPQEYPGFLMVCNQATSTIDAYTPAWYTQMGKRYLLSTEPLHASRVKFSEQNPFEFVRAKGGDPRSLVDLAFMSDFHQLVAVMPEFSNQNIFDFPHDQVVFILHKLEQAWIIAKDPESYEKY